MTRAPELGRFARRWLAHVRQGNLLMVSSSLAYVTMLSLVPLLAVSFAVFQAFGGLEKLYGWVEPLILENLAEGTGTEAVAALRRAIGKAHAGAIGAGGTAALLFTSMNLLSHVEKAINRIWKAERRRPWIGRAAAYLLFVALGPLAFSVALGVVASQALPLARILPSGAGSWAMQTLALFLIYRFVPSAEVAASSALSGAVFASTGITIARWGYALYATRVVSYHRIYGGLGAVPIFMVWIYVLWVLILTGAAWGAAWRESASAEARLPDK